MACGPLADGDRQLGVAGGQHGFYAEALRAHLRSLATSVGFGRISRSSGVARFVVDGCRKNLPLSVTNLPDSAVGVTIEAWKLNPN